MAAPWIAVLGLLAAAASAPAQEAGAGGDSAATGPVVRAVLFFSPTCPHCERVMREDLPPLVARHGARLRIVALNSSIPSGHEAYEEAIRVLGVPPSRRGVPLLVVGREHLVGSKEIPDRFPALVDEGLEAGGIDWPDLPRVRELLASEGLLAEPEPTASRAGAEREVPAAVAVDAPAPAAAAADAPSATETPAPAEPPVVVPTPAAGSLETAGTPGAAGSPSAAAAPLTPDGPPPSAAPGPTDRFRSDPVGNSASVAILLAMLAALGWSLAAAAGRVRPPRAAPWLLPALAIAGLGVAGYLAWVEATGSDAVCGPVGDCNTVQQSPYARLLGVPVGLLGLLGYAAMLAAWGRARRARPGSEARAWRPVWALALVATALSAWLTFLEPFVIGATCAWCLSSAVLVTGILLAATAPAWAASRSAAAGDPTVRGPAARDPGAAPSG